MKIIPLASTVGSLLLLAACSSSSSRMPVYTSNQTGTVMTQIRGEVVAVRDVLIQAPSRTAGSTGTGATLGAATVTSAILGSPGAVAGALGSVVGGGLGSRADNRMGEEITIRTMDGRTISVVQERDGEPFAPGEDVLIQNAPPKSGYGTGGGTRVMHGDPSMGRSDNTVATSRQ